MPSGQVTLKFYLSGTLLLLTQVLKLINNSWTKWKSLTDMLTCNNPIWFACGPLSFEHFHVCDLACYFLNYVLGIFKNPWIKFSRPLLFTSETGPESNLQNRQEHCFFHLGGWKKVSVKWKCLLFSVQIQSPWKIFWWLPNNFLCNSIKSTFNFAQKHSSKLMFLPENLDVFPKTDTGI